MPQSANHISPITGMPLVQKAFLRSADTLSPVAVPSLQTYSPAPLTLADAQLLAAVLATRPDIAHDPLFAVDYGVDWYHRLLTPSFCSYDDAALVREYTIARCREVRAERLRNRQLLDELNEAPQSSDHVAGFAVLMVLAFVFFLCWLVMPTDKQLQNMDFSQDAPAAVSR